MNDPNFREQRNIVDSNENPFWMRVGNVSLSAGAFRNLSGALGATLMVVICLVILPFYILWNVIGIWSQALIFVLLGFWWVVIRSIRAYRKAVK